MKLTIAPKKDQPKGGFKHPKHLLAYGPVHRFWASNSWHETNEYSIAPSASIYDRKYLNE